MKAAAAIVWGLVAVAAAAAPAQEAAEPAPRPGDTVDWHVVQPGENWQSITARYLGTTRLWAENWRLNPQLTDPGLLRPGQRLRVIVHRELPPRTAEIVALERRVERKPEPRAWSRAQVGDRLRERDGVRTYRTSSAELSFDDGARLLVGEESIVFLREVSATLTGVTRETVEIVEGQADLEARPARADSSDIEVIMGDTTARPRPSGAGIAQTRARVSAAGAAQVMVYGGESDVSAAGAQVRVPRGMGTSVERGAPPAPPEKLLPAPALAGPAPGSSRSFANPRLTWQPVTGAASYTVEVFRDRGATRLVDRATGVTGLDWQPEALPVETLYWRITAVADSGLDGFPSDPRAISIESARVDRDPPTVVAIAVGAARVSGESQLSMGGAGAVRLAAHDDASGVARVEHRWNGGEWQSGEPRPPENDGSHRLEFRGVDRLDRVSPTWQVEVVVDRTPPVAPSVQADPARE